MSTSCWHGTWRRRLHQIQLLRDTNMHASMSCKHSVSRRHLSNTHKVRSDGSIFCRAPWLQLNKRHTLDTKRTTVKMCSAWPRPRCPHYGDPSSLVKRTSCNLLRCANLFVFDLEHRNNRCVKSSATLHAYHRQKII